MSFERITDPQLRQALQQERTARLNSTPFSAYQYVDVTWTGAGEVDVAHTLKSTDVRWFVVNRTAAMDIYQPPSGVVKNTATTVWLTSSAAGQARLLLFVEA
jgi:hypothetical protein